MDDFENRSSGAAPSEWGPKTPAIVACAVVGVAFALAAVFLVTDAPGRFLGAVAAVGLLAFALSSWRARPKLRIGDGELVLRGTFGTTSLLRNEVDHVKISEIGRLGRRVYLLEIESGDQLIVLNRWDLGGDPRAVQQALRDAGYRG